MRESRLLSHIADIAGRLQSQHPGVIVGPGDDCAVVVPPGERLLLKTDQVVEGRHFVAGTPLDLVGRKAVARAISDVAAMAGAPAYALAAAALPRGMSQPDAELLADALHRWGAHWGCPIVGGDVAVHERDDGPLTITIGVVGTPHAIRGPVLRSGAKAGDAVYVSGALGNSLRSGRHLTFEPRVAEGAWLASHLGAGLTAMMDLSDGLGRDAGRLAAASGVRVELESAALPLHSDVGGWRQGAGEGEEYELLFTARTGVEVPAACPLTGVALTRIGACVAGAGCLMRTPEGMIDVSELGWDHG